MHFLVYHTKYSIGSQPGFPDLIIAGHGVVLAVECKGPTGTVSDKQTEWIQKLTEAGIPTWVAFSNRKADYDTIIEFLQTSFQRSVHVSRT
jgi:hypothetical protein